MSANPSLGPVSALPEAAFYLIGDGLDEAVGQGAEEKVAEAALGVEVDGSLWDTGGLCGEVEGVFEVSDLVHESDFECAPG